MEILIMEMDETARAPLRLGGHERDHFQFDLFEVMKLFQMESNEMIATQIAEMAEVILELLKPDGLDQELRVSENKCGNSKIEGNEACDDGNTISNDGWSSSWTIESGWTWSGTPSKWTKTSTLYWGDGIISQGEKCDDGNKLDGDGWSSKWAIESGYIWEGWPSRWVLVSELGGAAAIIGKTTLYTIIVNLLVSIISAFAIEGSAINLWAMLNMLQILHFVPMMTLYYPQVLLTMFSYIALVNMNNLILFSLFSLMIDQNQISSQDGLDYRFDNQSFGSLNIFMNSGDIFAFVMIAFFYIITVTILSSIFKPKNEDENNNKRIKKWSFENFKRVLRLLRNAIFFNFFIRFGYESFLELGLSSLLNIYQPSIGTLTEKESIGAVIIWLAFLIFIWALTLCVTLCVKSTTLAKKSVEQTIGSIYSGLKLSKQGPRLFPVVFLLRRIVIIIILVWLWNEGLAQLIILTITNLIVIAHLAIFRPYESKVSCIHTFVNELLLLVIWIMWFMYTETKTELTSEPKYERTAYVWISWWLAVVMLQVITLIINTTKYFVSLKYKRENEESLDQKVLPFRNIFENETSK